MNRFELGQKLKKLRGTKMLSNSVISANVIDSIENGKASYSVKKLLLYCGIAGISPAIYITLLDETRPIITVLDFHKAIARMLDIYNETPHSLYNKISINYTVPNAKASPLSIDTLLAICDYCDSEFQLTKNN